MLIFPFIADVELRCARLIAWVRWGLAGLLISAALAWLVIWGQSKTENRILANGAFTPVVRATILPPLLVPGHAVPSPNVALHSLALSAKEVGLSWMSSQVSELAQVRELQQLDIWQAQVNLQGSYPVVKRWLRDIVGRYPNLVLRSARWTRASGVGPIAAGGGDALDVQLQLVWPLNPVARGAEAPPAEANELASR